MSKFEAFCQANDNLFSTEVVARLLSLGKAIGYLFY